MKKFFLASICLLFIYFYSPVLVFSQIYNPVTWTFTKKVINATDFELVFKAKIDDGWYLYGMNIEPGGPIATAFTITEQAEKFRLLGRMSEPAGKIKFDSNFEMELKLFEKEATFKQKIRVLSNTDFTISGYVEFMCCDNARCLPPTDIEFTFNIPGITAIENVENTDSTDSIISENPTDSTVISADTAHTEAVITQAQDPEPKKEGLIWIFLIGFMGGLLALVTPCVFPMIPMTVSFFLRGSKKRSKAITDGLLFGISIVVIYVILGLSISIIFGANALNVMATSPIFNVFFFALLVVFAFSFFGAFELQFPSSWTTKLDSKADKTSGFLSLFFMAFTLVLVSFSCTGPIIGTLLVEAAVSGNKIAPLMGMTGFAIALAIPFSLFAVFPSWLKSMPKSGGWLNAVKVVLAFLLLAFSLKFLSTADLVGQWNILSRPVFLALWIVIFGMMGFYLLGKLKFSHDSDMPHTSIPRLIMSIAVFSFVVYMIPGLFGAPLKFISSFLPPMTTQDFVLGGQTTTSNVEIPAGKHAKIGSHGLLNFLEYEEGMAYAKEKNKPVFLDFTGMGCVNCKKMESSVWDDSQVLEMLRNKYIIISLYVDDRTTLPEAQQYISTAGGRERKIRTVGNKWSDFQAVNFGVNSQPYYLLLDNEGNKLVPDAFSFDTDIEKFRDFLQRGLTAYENK
ncbi:MAG: cytochrome c biogenesis protein CcdA [Bacteroidales bacterium]|nr:cytochrome c biogenesis protein CcdA [Bacteroidales bacterium]